MANRDGELTLDGLARVLRAHMDASAAEFAEMRAQFAQVGTRIDDLRGEIGIVAGLVRDLAQIVARHDDEIGEHRRQIRESNARIEEMTRDNRRILEAIERRGGNGGSRAPG
jgi:chromosome segregation ATPase